MRALVKYAIGPDSMMVKDVPEPSILPGHVLIEVKACGICGTDLHIQAGEYPINPPVIMGHEFSGLVAEIAPDVTQAQVGQRVVSLVYFTVCGVCRYCRSGQWNLCEQRKSVGSGVNGAFARYVLVPERNIRLLPDDVDFVAGAVTEPLACCTHGVLEKASTHPGDFALVTGPGAIGLLTAQILLSAGVTVALSGTHSDAPRLELARTLGVQHTIEVENTSVPEFVKSLTAGLGADWTFECSGTRIAAQQCIQASRRGGVMVQLGLFGKPIEIDWDQAILKEVEIRNSFASTWISWDYALKLMKTGRVKTLPLVSEVLPLSEWEGSFTRLRNKQALKCILVPD